MTPNPQDSAVALEVERAIREALSAGPTPGPWFTISRGQYWHEKEADVLRSDGEDLLQAEFVKPVGDVPTTRGQMYMRDAEYIAACNPEAMQALLAEIDRLRASQSDGTSGVPEGWKLVPVEPTDEMLKAGRKAIHDSHSVSKKALLVYQAMLATAPNQGENHVG